MFEWGDFIVPAWHTFFALGAIAAYILLLQLAKRHKPLVEEAHLSSLFVLSYIGGYFGARIFSIIVDQSSLEGFDKFWAIFQLGPMTFYGGLIGSICFGLSYALRKRLPIGHLADMAMICGMLGLAFGRIGCFLNGDDYGIPLAIDNGSTAPWWAVEFSNHQNPIPRVPVQLMESFFAAAIVVCFIWSFKNLRARFFPGIISFGVMAIYAIGRYFLEMFRGDPRGWVIEGLISPAQAVSILILISVNLLFVYRIRS